MPKQNRSTLAANTLAATQSWLAVVRAYNLCDAVLTARLAPLGLRPAEYEVLAQLARAPGSSQQVIAARCFVAKSGMSMLLTRLQERGLVERHANEHDARAKALHLTADGTRLAQAGLAVQRELVAAMTAPFSADEITQIELAMNRTSDVLQAMLPS
jgi:DNA-binding MarR family transcriptional regulator